MSKNPNEEINEALARMKMFMPKLSVSRENILKPTPQFIYAFYSQFLEECIQHEYKITKVQRKLYADNNEPKELILYRNVKNLLPVGSVLTVIDFYQPMPRRSLVLIKQTLHYLIYLVNVCNNELKIDYDDVMEEANSMLSIEQLCAESLDEIAELTSKAAKADAFHSELVTQKENIAKNVEKLENEQQEYKKKFGPKLEKIKKLYQENDIRKFKLEPLLKEVKLLKEQQVTEEELQQLIVSVEVQKKELNKWEKHLRDFEISDTRNCLEKIKEVLEMLQKTDFSSMETEKIRNFQDELRNINKELKDLLVQMVAKKEHERKLENEVDTLKNNLPAIEVKCSKVKIQCETAQKLCDIGQSCELTIQNLIAFSNTKKERARQAANNIVSVSNRIEL